MLNKVEARKYLLKSLNSGNFYVSSHAKAEMEKRNFDVADAAYIIKHGNIESISWNEKFCNWEIEIEGEDLEGMGLTLQIGLDLKKGSLLLITGHSPRFKEI